MSVIGATRLLETSRGRIGVGFWLSDGFVLPWLDGRWVAPDEMIRFSASLAELTDALANVGLPQSEAEAVARSVLDERKRKRESRGRTRAQRPPLLQLAPGMLLLALWTIGAGYWSLRAWRALREMA